jgi:hypothetical protein
MWQASEYGFDPLEGVGERDLGVSLEHRLGRRLGNTDGVDGLLQRLLEQRADHAGDGLDQGVLEDGELLTLI